MVIQILLSTVIITVNDWHQSCRYLTVKVTFFLKDFLLVDYGKVPIPRALSIIEFQCDELY